VIQLRPYQKQLITDIRTALKKNRSVLCQAPTGAGKTALAAYMILNAASKGKIVYFICHRAELLDQTAKTFTKVCINYFSFIASGYSYDARCPIQICSMQTLQNRLNHIIPDLVILDESHHVAAKGWAKVKQHFGKSFWVGLSATPQRLDGKGLDAYFNYMVCGPTVEWLIANGYLSDYDLYCPNTPDLTGVHIRMGDYDKGELDTAVKKSSITGDIIKHWKKYAQGKKTLGFAHSIEYSKFLTQQFCDAGVRATHLDGSTEGSHRRDVAKAFANGEYDIIFNVDLFGEGYDLSSQANTDVTVDAIIQARPTKSVALHLQQVGRALRPKADGSKAIILDHAGNCLRHGLPDDVREWSLEGSKHRDKKEDSEETINIRVCKRCFAVHRFAPICPYCHYEYEVKARKIIESEGELVQIDKEALRRRQKHEQAQAGSLEQLIELGKQRGYKYPAQWAAKVYSARRVRK